MASPSVRGLWALSAAGHGSHLPLNLPLHLPPVALCPPLLCQDVSCCSSELGGQAVPLAVASVWATANAQIQRMAWAHPMFWGAGCRWLAMTSFLGAPGSSVGALLRLQGHPGQLCLGRWHRAQTHKLILFLSRSDGRHIRGRGLWPPPSCLQPALSQVQGGVAAVWLVRGNPGRVSTF